jgi:hypothetical protein
MKIIVGTLVPFLLASALISNEAEAQCWWKGYDHYRCYHHGYYHGRHHRYYHNGYWYR